jgi:2-(3-amino-3-carboxypropyl)histidine synthase
MATPTSVAGSSHDQNEAHSPGITTSDKPVRRFVGRRRAESTKTEDLSQTCCTLNEGGLVPQAQPSKIKNRVLQSIPSEILDNVQLNEDLKSLPSHYNFEIHKTVVNLAVSLKA